jgi:hypothetical protein
MHPQFLDADRHLLLRVLVLEMAAQTVVPVAVVPVQTVEAVMATIVSTTRSQAVTVAKNLTIRVLDAETAEVNEAAGNEAQLGKQKKTRKPRRTEIEIVFGTGMVTKRRREIAIKTKIAEKETGNEIVSGIATATGTGIGIAEMIKTATEMSEKSETSGVAKLLPVLSPRGLIAVVFLLVLMLQGIETYQMAMRLLGKEEDLLTTR